MTGEGERKRLNRRKGEGGSDLDVVMEMIPSTFPHYIAHSLELTFIFTCTEATVSVLLIRLNVSDVLLTPVLSVFL